MSPYREPAPCSLARGPSGRTLSGFFTRLRRRAVLLMHGRAATRLPKKCPKCGRRSWDPHELRKGKAHCSSYMLNEYRCGHRGDLAGTVFMSALTSWCGPG